MGFRIFICIRTGVCLRTALELVEALPRAKVDPPAVAPNCPPAPALEHTHADRARFVRRADRRAPSVNPIYGRHVVPVCGCDAPSADPRGPDGHRGRRRFDPPPELPDAGADHVRVDHRSGVILRKQTRVSPRRRDFS